MLSLHFGSPDKRGVPASAKDAAAGQARDGAWDKPAAMSQAAEAMRGPWVRYSYDAAVLGCSAGLQVSAFVWTLSRHTPALSHVVVAVAVSQMLMPAGQLVWQQLRAQTPGMPPRPPPGAWAQAGCRYGALGLFVARAVWSGVRYGLWYGSLSGQLGSLALAAGPLAVGAGVLALTVGFACVAGVTLAPVPRLVVDTEGLALWAQLKAKSMLFEWRDASETAFDPRIKAAAQSAQTDLEMHQRRLVGNTWRAVTHARFWRNELTVGVALGAWQGTRWAQGHISARGALTGVMLLFPILSRMATPLAQPEALRPAAARKAGRAVLVSNDDAHSVCRNAMRAVLASALWVARPV